MYIKKSNMNYGMGLTNYDGLDVENIKPMTQIYFQDKDLFYCETLSDIAETNDITIITAEEYQEAVEEAETEIQKEQAERQSTEERLDDLEMLVLEMAGVI